MGLRLPAVISSNMVLHQKSSVKLWGWGDPGEKILIHRSWDDKTDSTIVHENTKWELTINTPAAGGPFTITIKGHNTIVLENILIGEVWVCSGQSNMAYTYDWGLPQMKEDLPAAFNPNIRFFNVPETASDAPQEDSKAQWTICDSNTIKSFSAVGYYFGRKLHQDLNVPIGLISASWGGTPAETWTPAELVDNDPVLKQAATKQTYSKGWPIKPGLAYNGMIAPLINYDIAGTIWYQGESNVGMANTYHQLFSTMIGAWRKNWNKEFPFYYVQLAPYSYGDNYFAALLREAQTKTLSLPKTGMVVISDLADTLDLHPKNKKEVGIRLAKFALADTYGKNEPGAKSPLFTSMEIQKDKLVLSFEHAEGGFVTKGNIPLGWFVAGQDRKFYPASIQISNEQIIVSNKNVKEPVAVRYAFSNTAVGNMFTKHGLPLAPFRTDDWE